MLKFCFDIVGDMERVEMGLHMPILIIYFLEQGTERNMLQNSVISLLLSHILCRLYSVVLIIKLYTSEASEP